MVDSPEDWDRRRRTGGIHGGYGSSAKNILKVARLYGFGAKGYRVEPSVIATLPMPCIIHWNMNHFVVLRGITKRYAFMSDPARGELKVPTEQFNTSFSGTAITLTPGQGVYAGREARQRVTLFHNTTSVAMQKDRRNERWSFALMGLKALYFCIYVLAIR